MSGRLGRYELLYELARGGMAIVWVGRLVGAEGFQRPVAIKVLLPGHSSESNLTSFVSEAKISALVESDHVVRTLDFGRSDDGAYLVMELVEGLSLRELAAAFPLPIDVACEIVRQAAIGLADAHTATGHDGGNLGIVHRDLSPHNVLLTRTGRVKLTDFGIALARDRPNLTGTGEFKGKIDYAAPELFASSRATQCSDVFAWGVIAWEVMTGKRFMPDGSPLAKIGFLAEGKYPRADEVRSDVPKPVADVIAAALRSDPSERIPDGRELQRALEAAVGASTGRSGEGRVAQFLEVPQLAELIEERLERVRRALAAPPMKSERPGPIGVTAPTEGPPQPWMRRAAMALVLVAVLVTSIWTTVLQQHRSDRPIRTETPVTVTEPARRTDEGAEREREPALPEPPALAAVPATPATTDASESAAVDTEPRRTNPVRRRDRGRVVGSSEAQQPAARAGDVTTTATGPASTTAETHPSPPRPQGSPLLELGDFDRVGGRE